MSEEIEAPLAPGDMPLTVGIGVKDLEKSAEFYTDILGFERLNVYELGFIEEIVLGYPDTKGGRLVLMNWPNDKDRKYDGSDVKLVFYVDDPVSVMERVRARGGVIEREAEPVEFLNNARVGIARDPDNYMVEIIEPFEI